MKTITWDEAVEALFQGYSGVPFPCLADGNLVYCVKGKRSIALFTSELEPFCEPILEFWPHNNRQVRLANGYLLFKCANNFHVIRIMFLQERPIK